MTRTRTPRDMPAQDPIDRLDESSSKLRQVASELYAADLEEITKKTEVHVHVTQPSHPDGRISELPALPVEHSSRGVLIALGSLATAALAIARALGWL